MVRTRRSKSVVVDYTLSAFALISVCSFCRVWLVGAEVIGFRKGTGKVAMRSDAFVLVIMLKCRCS